MRLGVYAQNRMIIFHAQISTFTVCIILDIQKACDSVWHDGLHYKLWNMGVKRRMWRGIKKMYESSNSVVRLEGKKSDVFKITSHYLTMS